jgi:SAM-dependent methyltransferase
MTPAVTVPQVRAYYERNTRLFRALGLGGSAAAVHRAVWADGASSYEEALGYVNRLVLQEAERLVARRSDELRALDLGCGIGGSLLALARALGAGLRGVGVSISPTQIRLARARAAALRLDGRCTFLEADFLNLPFHERFALAFAVESLVHAPDPPRVYAQAAASLEAGGRLLVCDDFVTSLRPLTRSERRLVSSFRRGWRAPGLISDAEAVELAGRAGLRLVARRDLTPDLRPLRLPAGLPGAALWLGGALPHGWHFSQSVAGGLALQRALGSGAIRYCWLVFEKV